jgi:hypothetical protein
VNTGSRANFLPSKKVRVFAVLLVLCGVFFLWYQSDVYLFFGDKESTKK